jgi:hypothetical protein
MGGCATAEWPAEDVTIASGLWIDETEVTEAMWRDVMGGEMDPAGATTPKVDLTWFDAAAYCNALSLRHGLAPCYLLSQCSGVIADSENPHLCLAAALHLPSCKGFRLPTEDEWEYAARAGTTGARYGPVDQVAWYSANSELRLHPAGEKQPNAFGLYDMLGNAAEWVDGCPWVFDVKLSGFDQVRTYFRRKPSAYAYAVVSNSIAAGPAPCLVAGLYYYHPSPDELFGGTSKRGGWYGAISTFGHIARGGSAVASIFEARAAYRQPRHGLGGPFTGFRVVIAP